MPWRLRSSCSRSAYCCAFAHDSTSMIVIFDVAAPLAAYSLLRSAGITAVTALLLSGVFPALGVAIGAVVVQTVRFDTDIPTTIPIGWLALVGAGACVAGLLAGVYPALRAGRVALNDPSAMS